MIGGLLIGILAVALGALTAPFLLLSDVSATSEITTSITNASNYIFSLNTVFPVVTLLAIIAFDLVFESAVFLYKGIRWIYRKIPGIS